MILEQVKNIIQKENEEAWTQLVIKHPVFDVNEALTWIRYWGNGGGPLSTETVIKDAITESKGQTQSLIDVIKSDSYYEWGNCFHYFDVISAMLPECQINNTNPSGG